MSSPDEKELELLAGEYVLGTLSEPQRRMADTLYQQNSVFRQQVVDWQQRLSPLDDTAAPIRPAPHIWPQIATQLSFTGYHNNQHGDHSALPTQSQGNVWQILSGFALAASLLLGVLLWHKTQQIPTSTPTLAGFSSITIVSDDNETPSWLVDSNGANGILRITALAPPAFDSNSSYQLWLVLPEDKGVRSMGLIELEAGQSEIRELNEALPDAIAFAVSQEPFGGSPTSVPTGPVLYQGVITPVTER